MGSVMGAGHEQDGDATDYGQDDGDDHQHGLHQLGAAARFRRVLHRSQSLDPTAGTMVTRHAYTHRLLEPLDVLAVAVNAVADVGGEAGVLGGAGRGGGVSGGVSGGDARVPGGDARVPGVQGSRALALASVLLPALAFPRFLPIIDRMELMDALAVPPRMLFTYLQLVIFTRRTW